MTPDPFLQALPSQIRLPDPVRTLHSSEGVYIGRCRIQRGKGWLVAMVLRIVRFPPSGEDVHVRLTIQRTGSRWSWERNFGGHITQSTLTFDGKTGCVREQLGPFAVQLQPVSNGRGLMIEIKRLSVLGIPIPAFLLPRSATTEWEDEHGRFRFDVSASAPGLGLLIRYQGWLTPDHAASARA